MRDLDISGQVFHPDGLHFCQRAVLMHDQTVGEFHNQVPGQVLIFQHLPEILFMLGGIPEDAQVIPYLQDVSHSLQYIGFLVENFRVILAQ